MITRSETAAATRQTLVDAARDLLDLGGPDAVTLREVGARAGVSRSAPYRHFADKESLLVEVAAEAWREVGEALTVLADAPEPLQAALVALVALGRDHPHLYRLMFATPTADPTALVRAAERAQDLFLELVAAAVGHDHARRYGALLLTGVHGAIGLEQSGHLTTDKWRTTAEELVELQLSLLAAGR